MNEFLRQASEYIRRMITAMTPGQLIGLMLLFILLVGSIAMALGWAAKDGFAQLVGAEVPIDVRSEIKKKLLEMNQRFEIREGAIFVPKEDLDELKIDLAGEGFFTDKQIEAWIWEADLTSTKDIRELRARVTLQRKLERKIASLDAVRSAGVHITPAPRRWRLGFEGPPPKAAVLLSLRPGRRLSQQNILGIAQIVASSVEGLVPENVTIMDTAGRLYKVPKPDSEIYFALQRTEAQLKVERMFEEKIRNLFPMVRDIFISARVVQDYTRTKTTSEEVKPGVDTKVEEFAKSSTTPTPATPVGIKGERTLAPPTTQLGTLTEKKTTTLHQPSKVVTWMEKPPGEIKDVSISVAFPKGGVNIEEKEIKDMISKGIGVKPENISVAFFDLPEIPVAIEKPADWERIYEIWERFGGQLLLAVIALISMFLIYRIVKGVVIKPPPRPEAPPEEERPPVEAPPEVPRLPTLEVEEVRTAQLRMAARDLTQRSPRSVAAMLRRWLLGR
jgi:flagellar M-ring protein FliF